MIKYSSTFILALLMLLLATATFFEPYSATLKVILFFALNALANAFLAYGLSLYGFKRPHLYPILLLFLLGTFMPYLGSACAIMIIIFHRTQTLTIAKKITTVDETPYVPESREIQSKFGQGGAVQRLKTSSLSTAIRREAIHALKAENNPANNALLHSTLSDSDDEIRLLAFSLLDQKMQKNQTRITELQQEIDQTQTPKKIATLYRFLAFAYWESIYLQLVQGEAKQDQLHLALDAAKKALKFLTEDGDLWALLGQIYLKLEQPDQAFTAFKRAKDQDVLSSKVVPYLAELYFLQGKFTPLKALFKASPHLADVPSLKKVVDFWADAS